MPPSPSPEATRAVLLLDGNGERIVSVQAALAPMVVTALTRVSDARARLSERRFDAVLFSPHVERVDEVISFLLSLQDEPRPPPVAMLAALDDLPLLIRQKMHEFQVLSLSAAPLHLRRAVLRLAGSAEGYMAPPSGAQGGEAVLLQTVRRALRVRDVVVRHQNTGPRGELQLVVPLTEAGLQCHQDLPGIWGQALSDATAHPVLTALERAPGPQEVYALPLQNPAQAWAYAVYRPWSTGDRATLSFGIHGADGAAPAMLTHARQVAVEELPRLYVPRVEILPGSAVVIPEYDWVATGSYIGIDRRLKAAPGMRRFMLFGRRTSQPLGARRLKGQVDRSPEAITRVVMAWAFLSGLDAAMGVFLRLRHALQSSASALMRLMIFEWPWQSWALKNLVVGLALAVLVRTRWPWGALVLASLLGAWLLLDVYWLLCAALAVA